MRCGRGCVRFTVPLREYNNNIGHGADCITQDFSSMLYDMSIEAHRGIALDMLLCCLWSLRGFAVTDL